MIRGRDSGRRSLLTPLLFLTYGAMATVSWGLCFALGRANPFDAGGWLGMGWAASTLSSSGMGLCIAALTVGATREIVRRAAWGRALHRALRPSVGQASDAALLGLALASAVGEEALFRGLLVPLLGIVPSALLFGALHQVRGPARWAWMGWATFMGALFGLVFAATGSLAGSIIAHAIINAANLRLLRDSDPDAKPKPLGGLLRPPRTG